MHLGEAEILRASREFDIVLADHTILQHPKSAESILTAI